MIELLKKLMGREDLTFQEASELIQWVMSEDAVAVQASALLVLLQAKGITDEEMAGAAYAMRGRVSKSMRLRMSSIPAALETGSAPSTSRPVRQSLLQQPEPRWPNTETGATPARVGVPRHWKPLE